MTTASTQKPGRPRSERSHRAVLDAARELLTDGGLPALTVDQIAIRAGVSKNTIYRWWPNKGAVLMDAFTEATSQKLRAPSSGSALERFRTQVHRVAALMNEPNARRPFVALVAASQHDPELAAALRDRFIADRRASAAALLTEVASEHPLTADLDPDIVIDLVYGGLYYRLLITGQSTHPAEVNRLLDAVLRSGPAT